jgi:CheY-like chemotaxis protein
MDKLEAKILLVEDEPILQYAFEKQLARLGYQVAGVAANGILAVERVLSRPYHLVFMDVRLPGLDRITATERIRAVENRNGVHTTIIGMTAFAERKRCLEAGMDDFLQKPVLLEQMEATLEHWLNPKVLESSSQFRIVKLERFSATDNRLRAIQEKIAKLRKSMGMDDKPKD